MSKDLREFLQIVRRAGPQYYAEVKKPLDPICEPSTLQHKLSQQGRFPVIYCPEIRGSKLPLVTNLFGSYELLGLALGLTLEQLRECGKGEAFQQYRKRRYDLKAPRQIPASEAPVRAVVLTGEDVDLGLLPITKHAELDSGKYITTGMTIFKDPDTWIPNIGMYRMEVKGRNRLGCMINAVHHGSVIARRYGELNRPIEMVTCIGHHPAVCMGAVATGPLHMNKLEVMGGLLGEPVLVTPALTVDLPVPAYSEIVIEGVIDPNRMDTDGPICEGYGYYGDRLPCYVVQIRAITMRQDAIYHDLYLTHQEHPLAGLLGWQSNIFDKVSAVVPNIKAMHFGSDGYVGKSILYISIARPSPGEARLAGVTALSAERYVKMVVVVDEDVNVHDDGAVLSAIATRVSADRDISLIPEMPSPILNPVAHDETKTKRGNLDTKIIIDATQPVGLPFPTRVVPPAKLMNTMNLDDYLQQA